jgi:hypothetical protein
VGALRERKWENERRGRGEWSTQKFSPSSIFSILLWAEKQEGKEKSSRLPTVIIVQQKGMPSNIRSTTPHTKRYHEIFRAKI